MPGQNRQPSFGGVAQLFGDASATDDKPKQRQASFGGVASLFGDDDDDNAGSVGAPASAASSSRRAPSFGGVANLFGGDENAPKPVKTGGRQASFGGVAALFGDDDEEAPDRIITKPKKAGARQASFGGVAALFGEDDGAGAAPTAPVGGKAKGKTKKRDPSFGGISNLFGDVEEPKPSKSANEGIGPLQTHEPNTKGRSKKRDPSFGGVAGLFADNDDDDEEEEDDQELNITFGKPTVNSKLTTELQVELENEREKVIALEGEMKQAEKINRELEERILTLEREKESLKASKMKLIQQTSREIDRMREVIIGIASETAAQAKAATVS